MPTILIAGGTGLVGKHLSKMLVAQDYEVLHLSRTENLQAEFPAYQWDLKSGTIDQVALAKADYVINLAGTGIADARWSKSRKKDIIYSRVRSNEILKNYFSKITTPPKAYIASAAIGYYGNTGDALIAEKTPAGAKGFLAESCIAWENAIADVASTGIRTVSLRIGIVLSTKGGALSKMLPSYMARIGAYFGDGQQYYSWIHIDDMCRMFVAAIENEAMNGVYNGVAPNPERNKDFAYKIAEALDKKSLIAPAPAFGLRLAMGEMADVVLHGNRVSAQKILDTGFEFQFPTLVKAVADVVKRKI